MSCYLYFDKKDKPIIEKFYINDETENKVTALSEVTLHLTWSDPYIKEYCISETNNVNSCTLTPSNGVTEVSQKYTFAEYGSKTFYAYIKDTAEGISEVKSDSIEYIKSLTSDELVNNPISGVRESTGVVQDELAVRYYGTNPSNYICFGTKDKNTCINNTDKYMYRIIGIDKSGRYKVIKKEALNTVYQWHSVNNQDIKWSQSDLYKGLNDSYFLSDTTYVPDGWSDKIETINWKYGDIYNSNTNTAINKTAPQILQIEQAWTTTTSAKIGLMYVADYNFAYQKSGLNCSVVSSSTYPTCKTSWIHLSQNDTDTPKSDEYFMSRYGLHANGYYYAWFLCNSGYIGFSWNLAYLTETAAIRPVFYLIPTIKLSGSGTITDPYIIVN